MLLTCWTTQGGLQARRTRWVEDTGRLCLSVEDRHDSRALVLSLSCVPKPPADPRSHARSPSFGARSDLVAFPALPDLLAPVSADMSLSVIHGRYSRCGVRGHGGLKGGTQDLLERRIFLSAELLTCCARRRIH